MRAQPSDLRVFKWVKSMMFIFHDNSGRDNDNDAVGKCDKSRWQSGWKENKEGGRPTNDEDVDKEVDEKDNRNNE